MPDRAQALRLSARLRELRQEALGRPLTQEEVGRVLRVAISTISSYESDSRPKQPPGKRLRDYALLFCTPRSLDGGVHLIAEEELAGDERQAFERLHDDLRALAGPAGHSQPVAQRTLWDFRSDGQLTIICPDAPHEDQPAAAAQNNPNYSRLYRYADLDALVELYGHVRATNPLMQVNHRLASEAVADDLSGGHLVLIGGVGWNPIARRVLRALADMPISQHEVPGLAGDVFRVADRGEFRARWEEGGDGEEELVEDVGLLVRRPHPFNATRTVTICNGMHSRGVLGAVRSLTDAEVRERNEAWLHERYPRGEFALLLRVPVLQGESISPDFTTSDAILYRWSPDEAQR